MMDMASCRSCSALQGLNFCLHRLCSYTITVVLFATFCCERIVTELGWLSTAASGFKGVAVVRFVVRVVLCLCVPASVPRVCGSRIGWIEVDASLAVTVSRGPAAVTAADPARAPARARGLGVGRTGRCGRLMAHGQAAPSC